MKSQGFVEVDETSVFELADEAISIELLCPPQIDTSKSTKAEENKFVDEYIQ
jgi:hypothetical protein